MSVAVACGAKRTTAKEPSLGALASAGPLEAPCSLTTTLVITAACTRIATAAAVADQASVRGVKLDRNSEMRLAEVERALAARRTRLLGIDRGEQLLHGARRRRTERLVEVDRLGQLLADEVVAPRKFAIACKRLLDAIGVTAAQRPGGMPRQQSFDLMALWLFIDHVHGQPLSIPAALSSSASRLRA